MLVGPFRVIHDTHLQDNGAWHGFCLSEKGGSAIAAEAIGDLVARVGNFGYVLKSTCYISAQSSTDLDDENRVDESFESTNQIQA